MTIREGLLTPGVGITLFHESLVETRVRRKLFPSTVIGDRKTLTLRTFPLSTADSFHRDSGIFRPDLQKKRKRENTALNPRDREIV